ncbi:MAG: hypothetical protein ACTHU1_05640 [Arachnia sp.]
MEHTKRRPSWNSDGVESIGGHQLSTSITHQEPRVSPLAPELSQVIKRALQETLAAALPSTWDRRAEQLERCRPSASDSRTGSADDERDARLAEQAEACREHARYCRAYPSDIFEMFRDDVLTLMGEERIFLERECPQVVRAGKDLIREAQDIIDLLRGEAV